MTSQKRQRSLTPAEINISPKKTFKFLCWIIFFLLVMNVVMLSFQYSFDIGSLKSFSKTTFKLVKLFDFNEEINVPTFYSAVTLFMSALLLFSIASLSKKSGRSYLSWLFLGFIFLFLTFDEFASLHELVIGVSRETFNASGYLYYAWVIPYAFGVFVLGLIYIPFLKNLPKNTRQTFLYAAAIYITGAIGFEMLGGNIIESQGPTPLFSFVYTIEETLEMVGIAVFIYALLTYISDNYNLVFTLGK